MVRNIQMIFITVFFQIAIFTVSTETTSNEDITHDRHLIEGRVFPVADNFQNNWQANTKIHVNGGEFIGFVKKDGSFQIRNVPVGSHVLEVLNADYTYEPVRVEINSKGKFRARKVNNIQTSQVVQVPYPLKMKALGRTRYFQMREQWRITDFLFNPMVLMMVLPLLLVMVLPKMLNDPETKKEMEQIGSLTKFELPEMSDVVSNFLAGGSSSSNTVSSQNIQSKKALKSKKRQ